MVRWRKTRCSGRARSRLHLLCCHARLQSIALRRHTHALSRTVGWSCELHWGFPMRMIDPFGPPPSTRLSRRQFMGGAGVACLGLFSERRGAASDENLSPPRFLLEWGRRGKGKGEFDACVGIAIGKHDEVYTSEFRNQRVQKFTSEGEFLGEFSIQPYAGGLAVDPHGTVYVAHWNSHKVAAYSPSGELLKEWGKKGTGDGEFQLPGSIALGPDGLLSGPARVTVRAQKFSGAGRLLGS